MVTFKIFFPLLFLPFLCANSYIQAQIQKEPKSEVVQKFNYIKEGKKLVQAKYFQDAFEIFDFYLVEGRHLKDENFLEYAEIRLGRYCVAHYLDMAPLIESENRLMLFLNSRKYIQDDLLQTYPNSFWIEAYKLWTEWNARK